MSPCFISFGSYFGCHRPRRQSQWLLAPQPASNQRYEHDPPSRNTRVVRRTASRAFASLALLLVVPVVDSVTESASILSVVKTELRRLNSGPPRADIALLDFEYCIHGVLASTPTRSRVAIVSSSALLEREVHIALGALGRVPSQFAKAQWVVADREVGDALHISNKIVAECGGISFVVGSLSA